MTDYSSQLTKDNKILVVKERGYGMSDLKEGNIDRVNFDRANQIPTLEELTLLRLTLKRLTIKELYIFYIYHLTSFLRSWNEIT